MANLFKNLFTHLFKNLSKDLFTNLFKNLSKDLFTDLVKNLYKDLPKDLSNRLTNKLLLEALENIDFKKLNPTLILLLTFINIFPCLFEFRIPFKFCPYNFVMYCI